MENFSLDVVAEANPGYNENCLAQTKAAAGDQSEDYLFVPFSVVPDGTRVTRFCGNTARTLEVTGTVIINWGIVNRNACSVDYVLFALFYSSSTRSIHDSFPQRWKAHSRQGVGLPY